MVLVCVQFALSGCVCGPALFSRAQKIDAVTLLVDPLPETGITDTGAHVLRTSVHILSRQSRRPIHVCHGELMFVMRDEHNRAVARWRIPEQMLIHDRVVDALGAGYAIELELPIWKVPVLGQGASSLVCGYAPELGLAIWSSPVSVGARLE